MAGRKLERFVGAIIGAFITTYLVLLIGSVCAACNFVAGAFLIAATVLGFVVFFILYRNVNLQFYIVGFTFGFLGGQMVCDLVLTAGGQGDLWVYWTIISICTLMGGVAAAMIGQWLVLLASSFIGAYILMRGFACFFGGYPDEKLVQFKIAHDLPLDLEWTAWLYFGFALACFVFNYVW